MLDVFFNPSSIAIIGASDKPGSLGRGLTINVLSSFRGKVYLVNVKGGTILGLPVYRSIKEVNDTVDLALIITPSHAVPEVLEESGSIGVRGAIIYSGGFREAGREDLEVKIEKIARKYSIRVLGPNCVGVIDNDTPLNATFTSLDRQGIPKPGVVSIISQSGALGSLILDLMSERFIGLRRFASVGNSLDVKIWEIIEYYTRDTKTSVIGVYFESIGEGRRLIESLERAQRIKPVIVLRGGVTEAGSRAALTHVAALAKSHRVVYGALKQARVVIANNMSDFISALEVLSKLKNRPARDDIIIVTNSGGMGVLLSDSLENRGLRVKVLSRELAERLRLKIPPYMSIGNPIDLSGAAPTDLYRQVVDEIIRGDGGGILIIVNQPQTIAMDTEKFIEYIAELRDEGVPFIVLMSGGSYAKNIALTLRSMNIPVASDPLEATSMVYALKTVTSKSRESLRDTQPPVSEYRRIAVGIIENTRLHGRSFMLEHEAKELVKLYNLDTPRGGVAKSLDEALLVADRIGYPLVAKIISPDVTHKSDIGGVIIGLDSRDEVRIAYEQLEAKTRKLNIRLEGILLEEMFKPQVEVAIGAFRDNLLGPVVMVGLGGFYIELLGDVSFRLSPLTIDDAIEMVMETSLGKLVEGYRGLKLDINNLALNICKVSKLMYDNPEILELDINPLAIRGDEMKVLDVKVKISEI
ncbi:MAG: acetate--CoA ligase family protein [Acidilobaceae archaeon]